MTRKLITLMLAAMLTMALCLSAAAETASWMPEWDMDADVVVVGFGPAGAMAAKSAMENGASVLVVEKASKEFAGGSAPTSLGFIKPFKEKCIRACGSKKPLEQRHKVLYVSKHFIEQRETMEAKIASPKGCLLRVNRSIQAEGNFAYVKHDLDFRRFLLRGNVKVAAEWLLFSLALNILKLHHKIQNKRLGSGLLVPKQFPAGL